MLHYSCCLGWRGEAKQYIRLFGSASALFAPPLVTSTRHILGRRVKVALRYLYHTSRTNLMYRLGRCRQQNLFECHWHLPCPAPGSSDATRITDKDGNNVQSSVIEITGSHVREDEEDSLCKRCGRPYPHSFDGRHPQVSGPSYVEQLSERRR